MVTSTSEFILWLEGTDNFPYYSHNLLEEWNLKVKEMEDNFRYELKKELNKLGIKTK